MYVNNLLPDLGKMCLLEYVVNNEYVGTLHIL